MRFLGFRIFTWIVLAINIGFLVWIIGGTVGAANDIPGYCAERSDPAVCEAASATGTGIGVLLIVFLWVAADVILGILWLITKPKARDCPSCGRNVRKGVTACRKCGFDFRQAPRVV